jgi:ferredoxin-NADP reductase
MDEALIKSYLPESKNDFDYYICGPEPMMDVAELTLRKAGVAWENIYAERFDLA